MLDTGCGMHGGEFDAVKIMQELKEMTKMIQDTFCNAELSDMLDEKFMQKHTEYDNLDQFTEAGGFDFSTRESVDKISEEELDAFVSAHTTFKSWDDMLISAMEAYSARRAEESSAAE